MDDNLNVATKLSNVTKFRVNATGEIIPRERFFSEEYYYGDFTKMNNYLIKEFGIYFDFQIPEVRLIDEIDYDEIHRVMRDLKAFTETPMEAVHELSVFDLKDLLNFLKRVVEEFDV